MGLPFRMAFLAPVIATGTMGTWALSAMMKPPFLNGSRAPVRLRVPSGKMRNELPAPSAGVLTKTLKAKGDKATVGEVIGYLEASAAPKVEASKGGAPKPEAKGDTRAETAKAAPASAAKTSAASRASSEPQASFWS